jgi:hypothetical protein
MRANRRTLVAGPDDAGRSSAVTGDELDATATTVRCPVCGGEATVRVHRHSSNCPSHCDIAGYDCGHGCQVDDETVRRIIGAQ